MRRLVTLPLGTGECPVWDARSNALWFVDIPAPALFRLDLATLALQRHQMPSAIGSFGLCRDHRLIVALRTGVHFYDPAANTFALVANPEKDIPGNRLNDGKVAPDGRFWVGSMDDTPAKGATAALYRIDHDGSCTRMIDRLRLSNGLAWSADGRTMVHSDTRRQWVQAWDYDIATGAIANRRTLCTLDDAEGRPDGAAMDMEGFYWSAGVSAGCLNRIGPDGRIERKLRLPVAAPTMPCFGGPDMKTLYITSLAKGDEAGTVLETRVDVPGVPVARFGKH